MIRRDFFKFSLVTSIYLFSQHKIEAKTNNNDLIIGAKLAIPKLMNPKELNGVKNYNLTIQENEHSFFKDEQTSTYAINGTYLGPTLLLKNGDNISINFTNTLDEITTMHGHGMHLPASMDGGPHQPIKVGKTWSSKYIVNQKACTNWYHPHLMGKTAEHVYKGLAGLIIIEDDESKTLSLPQTYGIDDIPLVVQDRVFDIQREFKYTPRMRQIMHGYRGETIIINGQIAPTFEASAGLLRMRILNGSNAGLYRFGFDNNQVFYQIATDNSFLEKPVKLQSVLLSPGERAEIVVDLSKYKNKTLNLLVLEHIDKNLKTALTINVNSNKTKTKLPKQLTKLDFLDESMAVNTRKFTLDGWGNRGNPIMMINDKKMDMNVINEKIPLNKVEIWEVKNTMNMPHNFHIHATHFIPLERDGSVFGVLENEKGYKDTMYIPPRQTIKFLVKMTDYADPNGKYMYHCHFLEHEDAGMMGQFSVIS